MEEPAEKEESELLKKRREKIESLKADGIDLYPNDARVADTTASVSDRSGQWPRKSWKRSRNDSPWRAA
jgi:lysyl-tRNA synthetase class II